MPTIKKYEVGETKCSDDGAELLMGCAEGEIISLHFKNVSRAQVKELERLLDIMGLTSVEVQTQGPNGFVVPLRKRRPLRPGQVI